MGLIVFGVAAVASGISVAAVHRWAIGRRMIDVPNSRSLHAQPTPRGGGLSIVLVVLIGALLLGLLGRAPAQLVAALTVGGVVAAIGIVDDVRGVSPFIRAVVHVASATVGVALVGGMAPLDLGVVIWEWNWFGHLVAVVGTVWMINLYNFMDGIDGLAGSEGLFIFAAAGLLISSAGLTEIALLCFLLAGACLGFLRLNWPPAIIFMGDVGSGFLGYAIAILALASANQGFSLTAWLILAGVFVVDATVTLLRRMRRGAKFYQAHRSHAFQRAVADGLSHRTVTIAIVLINLLGLFPLTILNVVWPHGAVLTTAVAVCALVALTVYLRAGTEPDHKNNALNSISESPAGRDPISTLKL